MSSDRDDQDGTPAGGSEPQGEPGRRRRRRRRRRGAEASGGGPALEPGSGPIAAPGADAGPARPAGSHGDEPGSPVDDGWSAEPPAEASPGSRTGGAERSDSRPLSDASTGEGRRKRRRRRRDGEGRGPRPDDRGRADDRGRGGDRPSFESRGRGDDRGRDDRGRDDRAHTDARDRTGDAEAELRGPEGGAGFDPRGRSDAARSDSRRDSRGRDGRRGDSRDRADTRGPRTDGRDRRDPVDTRPRSDERRPDPRPDRRPRATLTTAERDAGWSSRSIPVVAIEDEVTAPRAPEEPWGDDSAAPTAEVVLAPDLPPDPPADDPDPVTGFLDGDAPSDESNGARPVRSLIGIKFTTAGKIYLFDAGDDAYQVGEEVVVDTERGPRIGRVAVAPLRQEVTRTGPLRRVLRRPSRSDQRRLEGNRERAEAALRSAKNVARDLNLPIKVFRAELSLGGGKALIYFSSDEKVDVRRLVRDLSQKLHVRIELRQTGVRDEAKLVGGIGSCGQELCCTTWLPAFVPVSIKNAKDQGLVLNPTKVSGQCGRLKCCLVYEQATYAEMRRGLPRLGKRVVTASGEGRVVEVDVLRQRVRVSLVGGEVEIFEARDVKPLFPSQPGGRPGDQP